MESRIKDNADHAGHSLPLVLLSHGFLFMDNLLVSLNNNSLIALDPSETKDAMEDGHQTPLNTLLQAVLPQNQPIPMLLRIKLARPPEDHTRSQDKRVSQDAVDLALELTHPPSQSLLMLPTGVPTDQVSSITALPALTMQSFLSELALMDHGRSRTPGEPDGERLDTLDLPKETLVVSANTQESSPLDSASY